MMTCKPVWTAYGGDLDGVDGPVHNHSQREAICSVSSLFLAFYLYVTAFYWALITFFFCSFSWTFRAFDSITSLNWSIVLASALLR